MIASKDTSSHNEVNWMLLSSYHELSIFRCLFIFDAPPVEIQKENEMIGVLGHDSAL